MAIETMTTGEACRAIHEDIDRLLKSIPPMVLELDTPLGGADVGCLIANIHECAERILELNNSPGGNIMTDEQINARIAELRAKPLLKCDEAEIRELISYYDDQQLREIQVSLHKHIRSIERKKKHFFEYWRCKDILKWAGQEECSRPMTSDFLNDVFKTS